MWTVAGTVASVTDSSFWQDIAELTKWLDEHHPAFGDRLQWRIMKICQELGEVHEALGLAAGQNPRKNDGVPTLDLTDTVVELCDVVLSACVALQSIPGVVPAEVLAERMRDKRVVPDVDG